MWSARARWLRGESRTGWRLCAGLPRGGRRNLELRAEPDLNVVLRHAGRMELRRERPASELEGAVIGTAGRSLTRLNQMREEEGRGSDTRTSRPHDEPVVSGDGVDNFVDAC